MILATDMAKHFKYLAEFRNLLESRRSPAGHTNLHDMKYVTMPAHVMGAVESWLASLNPCCGAWVTVFVLQSGSDPYTDLSCSMPLQ